MGVTKINSPGYEIPDELENLVAITTLDKIYNWGRSASVWPLCSPWHVVASNIYVLKQVALIYPDSEWR